MNDNDIPNSYYFCSFRCMYIHFQHQPLLVAYTYLQQLLYLLLFSSSQYQAESYGSVCRRK